MISTHRILIEIPFMQQPPESECQLYQRLIRDVPDFPKSGIVFKDITPLCADPEGFRTFINRLVTVCGEWKPDAIVAVDARGFVFGGALAERLGLGVILVRKKGKLPAETDEVSYDLEYGSATLEMHRGALYPGQRVVVVDDLLATGGTVQATLELCRRQGAEVAGCAFLVELTFLKGRDILGSVPIFAPVQVSGE